MHFAEDIFLVVLRHCMRMKMVILLLILLK